MTINYGWKKHSYNHSTKWKLIKARPPQLLMDNGRGEGGATPHRINGKKKEDH